MAERKKTTGKATSKTRTTQRKWIRNLRNNIPAYLRLDSGKTFELRPRGERGDSYPVSKEDLEDIKFKMNEGLLFEIITEAEANKNITKQMTNQQAKHPALDKLRNEKDEPYEKGIVFEESYEDQGKVVAGVTTDGKDVNITRAVMPGTIDNPVLPADQKADAVARGKGLEGPAAGLGGEIKVTTEEVQKT